MKRFCRNFCFGSLMACIPIGLIHPDPRVIGIWAALNLCGWLYGHSPDKDAQNG